MMKAHARALNELASVVKKETFVGEPNADAVYKLALMHTRAFCRYAVHTLEEHDKVYPGVPVKMEYTGDGVPELQASALHQVALHLAAKQN
jgi:hypothetical protein